MSENYSYKRRHYFIDRKFQMEFSFKFLVIIAATAIAILLLFLFNSRGTLTAGYTGSEVKLLQTSDYFLSSLLMSTVGIVVFSCLTGIVIMILMSHRIAGPIFRFQKVLDELGAGDLTLRFNLRDKDQFKGLADRINMLADIMDDKIGSIKMRTAEISRSVDEIQSIAASDPELLSKIELTLGGMNRNLLELRNTISRFNTTQPK